MCESEPSSFAAFRRAVDVPLLANMTEFGKSPLLSVKQLEDIGFNMVIYPVTCLRLAMKAVEEGLARIKTDRWEEVPLDRLKVSIAPTPSGFGIGARIAF